MSSTNLEAKKRDGKGSAESRRLRAAGMIPAVIYGHKEEASHISISEDSLSQAFRGHTHLCQIQIEGGGVEQVVVKDVQFDALGDTLFHVDFLRVDMNEKTDVSVSVVTEGHPKGLADGGILEQNQNEVLVRCTPDKIPDVITLNVEDLGVHDAIRAKDLPLAEGVEAVGDPEAIVVTVVERFRAAATTEGEDDDEETPSE